MQNAILILKLIPVLIDAIKALEAAIPGEGKGELKLKALREILEVADSTLSSLWPQISAVVGVLVKAFNNTSVFK